LPRYSRERDREERIGSIEAGSDGIRYDDRLVALERNSSRDAQTESSLVTGAELLYVRSETVGARENVPGSSESVAIWIDRRVLIGHGSSLSSTSCIVWFELTNESKWDEYEEGEGN